MRRGKQACRAALRVQVVTRVTWLAHWIAAGFAEDAQPLLCDSEKNRPRIASERRLAVRQELPLPS
jgi:hypothetical protein